MNRKHSASTPAHIEALESRQLFSASPVSLGVEALVYKAASHAHAAVPVLTGAPFVGLASSNQGDKGSNLRLTITAETKSGGLKGTLLVDVGSDKQKTYAIKGSVNHLGMFVLHASGPGHSNALINGKVSADGNTLTGRYVANDPGHHGGSGTFTMSR